MPSDRGYLYFPMVSRCQRFIAFGASPNQHDHFTSDYEIFVAPLDPATLELTGDDVLSLAGMRDLAQTPNHMTAVTLAITPSRWPVSAEGLAFAFQTADKTARCISREGQLVNCELKARRFGRTSGHRALELSGGSYIARSAGRGISEALKRANAMTIEAVVTPDSLSQSGPARIVSLSRDTGARNFTLGQEGDALVLRTRTPQTGENGANPEARLCRMEPGTTVHIAVTYSPGLLVAYVDGREVTRTSNVKGDFSNWEAMELVLGDELTQDRDWKGQLEGVAIYSRALTAEELAASAKVYAALRAARTVIPRYEVEAEVVASSPIPSLDAIAPYNEALVTIEYRVTQVLAGEMKPGIIRVVRWGRLDRREMASAKAAKGHTQRLILEPFDLNQQLHELYREDTLDFDADQALYFAPYTE